MLETLLTIDNIKQWFPRNELIHTYRALESFIFNKGPDDSRFWLKVWFGEAFLTFFMSDDICNKIKLHTQN